MQMIFSTNRKKIVTTVQNNEINAGSQLSNKNVDLQRENQNKFINNTLQLRYGMISQIQNITENCASCGK